MTEVFGRPIEGHIQYTHNPTAKQDPDQTFIEYLDRLLDTPGVLAVRWDQYTPYFNDGDECVFSSREYSAEVLTAFDTEWLGEDSDPSIKGDHDTAAWKASYGDRHPDYRTYQAYYTHTINGYQTSELERALDEFKTRLDGPHEVFLKKTFGDHAEVTATKEGFSVDFYDHE